MKTPAWCTVLPLGSTGCVRALLVLAVSALALAGCGDRSTIAGTPAEPQPLPPAVAAFRDAFETQRYDLVPALAAQLSAAAADAPEDPELALTLGLVHLWGAAEVGRIGGDAGREATHALEALTRLEHARTVAPDDARIDGFIGAVRMRIGLETGNADLVARGLAEIAAGAARHPEFNEFVLLLVLSRLPRDDARFAGAFAATRRTMEACNLPVTEETPSLALDRQPVGITGPDRVCWNGPRALHNFEGTWLFVGDLYVKGGRPDLARALYANARTFPESFATWGFHELLDERIERADEHAARFADADPANDPEMVADSPVQCAVCHAR
jgi:hypothetical protein